MGSTILVSVSGFDNDLWISRLKLLAPNRSYVTKVDDNNSADVDYAVVWKQAEGLLKNLPNLKVIFSAGAGVDHIIKDRTLPDVPIVRIVADDLTNRMSEYIIWQALDHVRQGTLYREQQAQKIWQEDRTQIAASDVSIGILGMGQLGKDAARKLQIMGFNVIGWSRSKKTIEGIETFDGMNGLRNMLARTEMLICLLPLTDQTRGIINYNLINQLKSDGPLGGPIIINAGRGGLQNETDILAALNHGVLSAASLDVFQTEPLPKDSPLWSHPRITITPHAAAASNPEALIPAILQQIADFEHNGTLQNVVDMSAGY